MKNFTSTLIITLMVSGAFAANARASGEEKECLYGGTLAAVAVTGVDVIVSRNLSNVRSAALGGAAFAAGCAGNIYSNHKAEEAASEAQLQAPQESDEDHQ
jgi:uncharacterized membrane protein YebE (DUF533 family)